MFAHVEALLYRALRFNPCIVVNELRMRLRGSRPFLVLLFYAAIASLTVLVALLSMGVRSPAMHGPRPAEYGRIAFAVLATTQLTLILILLPAYGAGAITMEREKRTLEMLRVALVTPTDLITGKYLAILSFGLLLLLASLPVAAWCIMLGGIAPEEVLAIYVHLFLVGAAVTSLGLMYSVRVRRSMGAVAATYATIVGVYVLTVMLPGILSISISRSGSGTYGSFGATAIVLIPGCMSAWLLFLVIKRIMDRLLLARRPLLAGLLALLPTLAVAAWLVSSLSGLHTILGHAAATWTMVLNPYVTLYAALYDEVARGIAWRGSMGAGAVQPLILRVSGGILVLLAVFLWTLAIRSMRSES